MRVAHLALVAIAVAVAPVLAQASSPGGPVALTSGETAHLQLVLRATPASGSTFRAAATDAWLGAGDEGGGAVGVGTLDRAGRLITDRIGSTDGDHSAERIRKFAHRWIARVRAISLTTAGVELELNLKHEFGASDAKPSELSDVRQTVKLEWGQPRTLDFVAFPPSSDPYALVNASVEILATPSESPVFAADTLAYDLWLTPPGPGVSATERLSLRGRQGESVPFRFPPREIVVARTTKDALRARFEISGTVTGRLQRDGSVVMVVSCRRRSGLVSEDATAREGSMGSEGGTTTVVVKVGEAARFELPAFSGYEAVVGPGNVGAKPVAPGVTVDGGRLSVDWPGLLGANGGTVEVVARRGDKTQ